MPSKTNRVPQSLRENPAFPWLRIHLQNCRMLRIRFFAVVARASDGEIQFPIWPKPNRAPSMLPAIGQLVTQNFWLGAFGGVQWRTHKIFCGGQIDKAIVNGDPMQP